MYYLATNKFHSDIDHSQIKEVIPLHIAWTKKMITEGKIIQAGKWGDCGGMAIFEAKDISEAQSLLGEDPLIKSGLVNYELEKFYPDVKISKEA